MLEKEIDNKEKLIDLLLNKISDQKSTNILNREKSSETANSDNSYFKMLDDKFITVRKTSKLRKNNKVDTRMVTGNRFKSLLTDNDSNDEDDDIF